MTGPVLVLGDLMLDRAEVGTASRLSPEAPVVVLANPVRSQSLGGAGNAAANVLSLGLPVVLLGALGDDEAGDDARALAAAQGIDDRTVAGPDVTTTVKTRFLAGPHQVLRLDVEVAGVPEAVLQEVLARASAALAGASVLVLSDYDKGLVTPQLARTVIDAARRAGVPVVVDSKKTDVSCFVGCTVIAPNHHEARAVTGQDDPELAAAAIAAVTGSAVLVTLGAAGMLLSEDGRVVRLPTRAELVADVTGAGDTVTAALAVALAEGLPLEQAARWANAAAAVAVSHVGTHAVERSAVAR